MKRTFTVWLAAFGFAASALIGTCHAVNVTEAAADVTETTVEYSFDSATELNDFSAAYVATESGVNGTVGAFTDYFSHDAAAGKVTSKRQNSGSGSTGAITSLVLNKYSFTNFHAEVVMDFDGDSSWGWGGLQFRKSLLNAGWRADGCFGFVQMEGHATIWGSSAFDDTTIEQKCSGGFSKNSPFLLTVEVVGRDCSVAVTSVDKQTTYAVKEYTFEKAESVVEGYVALQSVDNSHNFYSLKITNLDADGNAIPLKENKVASEITLSAPAEALQVGEPIKLDYEVDGDMDEDTLAWSVNDESVAFVNGGWLTGLKTGEVTVTVTSMLNPLMTDSLTLTLGEADDKTYDFASDEAVSVLTPAYVAFKSDPNGGDESFLAHWAQTSDGTIKRTNLTTSTANDENFAYLYDKKMAHANFEATLVYRNTNAEYGWIGISSGMKLYNERCIDQGLGSFVQREGYPTTWGGDLGTEEVTGIAYDQTAWHTLRVRVYGRTIEMYIDDMQTPASTRTCPKSLPEGYVGFFTTCQAVFEIASFTVKPLNASGAVIDFSGIESISFSNKVATAKVGDKLTLGVEIVGSSEMELVYNVKTSNGNIAFVNNGILYFISDGTVEISIECPSEARLTDSFTVTVEKAATGEKDYYYPEGGQTGGSTGDSTQSGANSGADNTDGEDSGCGSLVMALPAAAVLSLAAAFVAVKRRNQR